MRVKYKIKYTNMKLYTKIIDGQTYIMPSNKIIVIKDNMQIFNPTEELLTGDGWKEYIAPANELTDEQILAQEKDAKIHDVIEYDSSTNINVFHVGEMPIWLDKATRAGLMLRFNAELAAGKTETSLWYNACEFKLPLTNAIQMLYAIEVYASVCYDNTQKHIAEIKKINNLEDLRQYDYTINYPDKLVFK